jgi:hypothetical protein
MRCWIARDKNGDVYLYENRPVRMNTQWAGDVYSRIDIDTFHELKPLWSDKEPIEVEVTIKKVSKL